MRSTAHIAVAVRDTRQQRSVTGLAVLVTAMLVLAMLIAPAHAAMQSAVTIAHASVSAPIESVGYARPLAQLQYSQANAAYDDGDRHLAHRLWLALAQQGHSDAAFKVGMLYDRGEVVEHDPSRAAYWYNQAARAGNMYAQHNLGVAYANGDGVDIDIATALNWWHRAAAQGNVDSQYNLGIVYATGTHGIKRDTEKAAKWWRQAARKGDAMAQYNLGALYANGDNGVNSVCEAVHWLKQSVAGGVEQAGYVLEALASQNDAKKCR